MNAVLKICGKCLMRGGLLVGTYMDACATLSYNNESCLDALVTVL